MRKALLGLIMAATVMSPIVAQAQDRGGRADRGRATSEQRQAASERRAQRSESRSQRQGSRQETRQESRQEARSDRRAARQQTRQGRQQARQAQPVAVAQRDRGDRRNRAGRPGSVYPQAWQGNPNDPARQRYERLERQNQFRYGTREQRREIRQERRGDRRDDRRDWRGDRRDDRRDWRDDRRDDRRDWRRDRRDDRRDWRSDRRADRRDWRRDWNRNSWRSDRRYDWRGWRYRNRGHYRLSPYYSPYRSHRYSRFSIGLFLQPLFFSQRYWIGDPWSYRLPPAPAGTQWVRYYNDVILVDVYNGEVIDVIYDFFW